jgi:hypothetical protein
LSSPADGVTLKFVAETPLSSDRGHGVASVQHSALVPFEVERLSPPPSWLQDRGIKTPRYLMNGTVSTELSTSDCTLIFAFLSLEKAT